MPVTSSGCTARRALPYLAAVCVVGSAPSAHADSMVDYQRAAAGAVLHEYDAGGPYLRAEFMGASDEGAIALGLAGWRGTNGDWGASLPGSIQAGIALEPVRVRLGAGIDAVHVDRLGERTGIGLLAPLALIDLDLAVGAGIRIGAEARAEYRWKSFGSAYEQAQLSLGLTLAFPLEQE